MMLDDASLSRVTREVVFTLMGRSALVAPAPIGREAGALRGDLSLHGPWRGALSLVVSRRFAVELSSAMFSTPPDRLSTEMVRDALAELTNIVGGNVKAFLSGGLGETCVLGAAEVSEVSGLSLAPSPRFFAHLTCGGEPISVLLSGEATRTPRPPTGDGQAPGEP